MVASRDWRRPLKLCGLAAAMLLCVELGLNARATLPTRLSDQEFWTLVQTISEPNGFFRSDNIVSDETAFGQVVPELSRRRRGGAYVGVGPEQNFTYIAALEPPMAFVLDIRRGNLHLQLLYKALFELSANRSEFISRLFVKPRQAGLTSSSSAADVMRAYWNAGTIKGEAFQEHLNAVKDVLVTRHGLPLSPEDLQGIEYVYHQFYWFGPMIRWDSSSGAVRSTSPAMNDLLTLVDANGAEASFLATEARFNVVKNLQAKNLVVPVVGNFAGPIALRAIGKYVRDHDAVIDTFYVSEVEPYLLQDGAWPRFCANVASLPVRNESVLIRPSLASFGLSPSVTGISTALREAFTERQARLVPIASEFGRCGLPAGGSIKD